MGARQATQEAPIDVAPEDNPTSEPEPDLAVLAQPCLVYEDANPWAFRCAAYRGISDTTLAFDLRIKARLYARAGIEEYWVVDVAGRRIVVHREPRDGVYGNVASYFAGECIEPLSATGRSFRVDDAFPGSVR